MMERPSPGPWEFSFNNRRLIHLPLIRQSFTAAVDLALLPEDRLPVRRRCRVHCPTSFRSGCIMP